MEGGVSGVELNTGVGTAAGIAAGGATGTLRKRSSTIGTLREYQDTGMNMAFLDSYFSEVRLLQLIHRDLGRITVGVEIYLVAFNPIPISHKKNL